MTLLPETARGVARTLTTGGPHVVLGLDGIRALQRDLDRLHAVCLAPATVRTPWLFASLGRDEHDEPWAVVVRSRDGSLAAAAVLSTTTTAAYDLVTLAGSGWGHRGELVAKNPAAGILLGDALARELMLWPRPMRLSIGPVDSTSVAAVQLLTRLPGARAETVEAIPVVRVDGSRSIDAYLSSSVRRTLRKASNRLERDGYELTVRFTRDGARISRMLPTLEALHRGRDRDRGRPSELDDPAFRLLWHARMRALASARSLELATAHIGGELAAYVLGVPDEPAYRVLEGHLATEWARYAPGRVLETAVLQRVLDDSAYHVLDWMTSIASETLLAANDHQDVMLVRLG